MLKFKKYAVFLFVLLNLTSLNIFAASKTDEIDLHRASLSSYKDKTSPSYIKEKDKLKKLIEQSHIDYTPKGRVDDVKRLINEKKYSAAIYELKDMIDSKIEPSFCYEMLAVICSRTSDKTSDVVQYLKKAISEDNDNVSAIYKLAKLYLKEKKNILGTEYLKKAVELSKTPQYFSEIENIILYKVTVK